MARFRAWIQGARGMASRLGNSHSGMNVCAQSYSGDVAVYMDPFFGDHARDGVTITVRDHASGLSHLLLYHGDLETLRKGGRVEAMRFLYQAASKKERAEFMELLARRALEASYKPLDTE